MRTAAARGFAIIFAGLSLSGCFAGDCENIVMDTLASPGGAEEVRIWRRNCGATTAYDFHFELVEAGAPQRDIARGSQVFLIGKGAREDYQLSWSAPDALTVQISAPDSFVFKQEPDIQVGDCTVVISYP